MKLYLYYLIDPDAISKINDRGALECLANFHDPDQGPMLYAATTDKKLAKKYEATHNMDKFKKIVKYIDTEDNISEADMWAVKITERSLLFSHNKHIIIPMTGNESWCADSITEVIYDNLCNMVLVNPSIFDPDMYDALAIIGYTNFFQTPSMLGFELDEMYCDKRTGIKDWANELGMYGWVFREIINLEGVMEVGEIDDQCLLSVRGYTHPR